MSSMDGGVVLTTARKHFALVGVSSLVIVIVIVLGLIYDRQRSSVEILNDRGYSVPEDLKFDYLDVSFLGDSDTAGVGAGRPAGFEALLSRMFCWAGNVSGQRGTGYTNSGAGDRGDYASRIGSITATTPDLVFVQGGLNDLDSPNLAAAAFESMALLRAEAGDAFLLVIGPAPAPSVDIAVLRRANDLIRDASVRNDAHFVDLLSYSWAYDPENYVSATVFLNMSGHKLLAEQVATDLKNIDASRFLTCDPV
nr:SGNH/GDSL hydrolase family protein [uncultured Rhodococcus sp.]